MNKDLNRCLRCLLGLSGLIILAVYKTCPGSCSSLSGSLASIDLTFVGAALMVAYLIFLLLKFDVWAFRLIALACGGEVFLIGYQLVNQVFCLYCLCFAAAVFALFLMHLKQARRVLTAGLLIGGFVLFLVGFSGRIFPAYGGQQAMEEQLVPSYGEGNVEFRLYTDYFCWPCRAMEKELDILLPKLLESGKVRITFVDTPIHSQTGTYARYFLYALKEQGNDFAAALELRKLLFRAAEEKIEDEQELQGFLASAGVDYEPFDLMPTLREYSRLINDDRVASTPRMVCCT